MSQPDSDRSSSDSSRRILSALADGDATDSEAARAFQAWRDDPDARVVVARLPADRRRAAQRRPGRRAGRRRGLPGRAARPPGRRAGGAGAAAARRGEPVAVPAAVNAATAAVAFARPLAGPGGDGRRLPGGDRRAQRRAARSATAAAQRWRRRRGLRPADGVGHVGQQRRRRRRPRADARAQSQGRGRPARARTSRRTASRR